MHFAHVYGTSFIGRREELDHLAALFDAGARLVTLVGPPGVGKTRLAAQLADRRGARIVDLTEARGRADLERLAGPDRTRPGLLVLDNFEHLLAEAATTTTTTTTTAAAALPDWLAATPGLALLVTSRAELHAPGERIVHLPPLALPDAPDEHAVRASPAAQLFLDRAPAYQLTPADAPHVARIVRELDGLPLAIELAASRMKVLSPAGLADRLAHRLDVLGALRGAIDWSWSLLDDTERSVLAQCSVFRGSFPLDAAEAVIDTITPGPSLLDAFQSLTEKSLLRSFRGADGHVRFALYESIREYAAERLAERPEHVAAVFRHGRYYARVTRTLGEHGGGGRGLSMVRRLELDLDNLLGAFESLLDHPARLRAAATRAMDNTEALLHQLAGRGKLGVFHAMRDAAADISAALETFDDRTVPPPLRAAAYRFIAVSYAVFARPAEADAYFDRALATAADDPRARGRTLYAAGTLASSAHRYDDARRALDEALSLARRTADRGLEANVLAEIGNLHMRQRRPDPAIAAFDRAATLARAIDRPDGEAYLEANAAAAARDKGDLATARARLARALSLHEAAGDDLHAGAVIAHQGALAHEQDDLPTAVTHYRAALERIRATGARRLEGLILSWLGGAHARAGDRPAAAAAFEEAAARANDLGDPHLTQCLALHRASLDLAESRAAPDPETAAAHRARAAAAVAAATDDTNDDVRFARRLLEHELADGAWTLAADGTWFQPPGDARVDLSRKKRMTRLLAALVTRHAASPGSAVSAADLIAEVWQGERMDPQSGHNRIQVALTTLRKLGLRELITRDDRGYYLDPHIPLRID